MDTYNFKGITLLITHYNRSSSLENLLKSFHQKGCSFDDIVVSDDGSRDEHLKKIKLLQLTYPFRLITTPENKGLGNNINKGQDAVLTPYTLYVQEDFDPTGAFPSALEAALNIIAENQNIDIVRFYSYFKYPYLTPYKYGFSKIDFKLWYPGYRKFYCYSDHPHLRRSSFFEKFGRYAEGLKVERTEYKMMMSFLKNKGEAMYFEEFKSLFEQKNSSSEPSTVRRNFWRESQNPFMSIARHTYRHIRLNFDYLF